MTALGVKLRCFIKKLTDDAHLHKVEAGKAQMQHDAMPFSPDTMDKHTQLYDLVNERMHKAQLLIEIAHQLDELMTEELQ